MMTLRLFSHKFESVPAATSWYLADLGEARGKQELFIPILKEPIKLLWVAATSLQAMPYE
jgi:hypothetical protein